MSNKLVSVIISTYNSSQFIVETLESIYKQSWEELELIITDDCSTDSTVMVVKEWIARHEDRFIKTIVLESDINTGVSANANRGLAIANGDWIKFIGADDTLFLNCITDNMNYVTGNSDVKVVFSGVNVYANTFEKDNFVMTLPGEMDDASLFRPDRSVESQYRMLLISDRINFTPSVFIKRELLMSVGGFDERFRLLEDYPLWLNLTKRGFKLYYMDKVTVNYRQHSKAINNTGRSFIINPNYFKQEEFRKIYIYPNLPTDIMLKEKFKWYASQPFRIDYLNKRTKFNGILSGFLIVYINPFRYFLWLKKRVPGNKKLNEFYF